MFTNISSDPIYAALGLTRVVEEIIGGEETPYSGGVFKLKIQIPDSYPFEPPKVHFVTPIYHPNIDTGGHICLDTLKTPLKGAWKPCLNISTVLTSIQLLMAEPNPDNLLMIDIELPTVSISVLDVDEIKKRTESCSADVEGMKLGEQKNENRKRNAHMQDMTNKLARWL